MLYQELRKTLTTTIPNNTKICQVILGGVKLQSNKTNLQYSNDKLQYSNDKLQLQKARSHCRNDKLQERKQQVQ